VLQSLPFPLRIPSASHQSISNRMVLMFLPIQAISSPCFYLTANGSSVNLARKTYPFAVQCLKILQIICTIWAAHVGILSSPIGSTASLSMCSLVPR
jgi:hypothetical protein